MADKADPLLNSTVAGRYEIFAKLGEGGMGAVYAAKQKPLGRTIALKVLLKSLSEDEIAVQRFEKEALAISRLAHPNTVTIFDYGKTEQGLMYIAMEFMEGRTLSDVISQDGPLRPRRVVRIIAQIVRALSEAHQRGVIHRDLKPDNIMLVPTAGEPDFVKVLDFGVAKLRAQEGVDVKTLTKGDVIFGTPAYMSPQQVHGIMDDPRSDLYAVGVMAYEMLAGVPLFTGDSAISILMAQVQKIPPAFASLARPVEVPAELEALVMKLLAKEADDRFADCEALLHGLDQLPGIGGGLRPPSGDTIGMQAPLPAVAAVRQGTQMMGSDFAESPKDDAALQADVSAPLPAPEQVAGRDATAETQALMAPQPAGIKDKDADLFATEASALAVHSASPAAVTDPGQTLPDLDAQAHKNSQKKILWALALVVFAVVTGLVLWHLSNADVGQKHGPANARQTKLEVLTKPAGAQIFLDDKAVGRSPVKLSVQVGRAYSLRAELDAYVSSSQQVNVQTDTRMQFTLVPRAAVKPRSNLKSASEPTLKAAGPASKMGLKTAAHATTAQKLGKKPPTARKKQQHKKPAPNKPAHAAPAAKQAPAKDFKAHKTADKLKDKPAVKPASDEGSAADFEKFDDFKAVE